MPAVIDDIMPEVLRLLAERAGMAAELSSISGIAHAVRKRIAATEAATPQDYLRRLNGDAAEFQELLEDLVVPETWFFRDALAFRCLMRHPETATALRRGTMRILSIGCSTGEEVYSLAMALREAGFMPAQFSVLGTDISRRSLDLARKAAFASRSFRETDKVFAASCQRWCERVGELWQVREEVRAAVDFRWENVAQPGFLASTPPFDAIFCRNVLIYFHAKARRTVIDNVKRLLDPEGILYAAPAEARIFSEGGFRSLGSEFPFAFRSGKESKDAAVAAPPRLPFRANAKPTSIVDTVARPPESSRPSLPVVSATLQAPADPEEPVTIFADSTSREGLAGNTILRAAEQAADSGRLEEADALCGQVLLQDPASARAHYLRGVVRQAQGALGEAQRSLERALYLDPTHHRALIQMMLLAEQCGDFQAAANYRRRAQQAAPSEAK